MRETSLFTVLLIVFAVILLFTPIEAKEKTDTIDIEYLYNVENRENTIDNRIRIYANANMRTDRERLIENIGKLFATKSVDTVPEKFSKGQNIIINKSLLTITLYEDGKVIKKYPISIGTKRNPTPNGVRTVQDRVVNPYWGGMFGKYRPVRGGAPNNPLGKRWMGLKDGYGIHGTLEEWSIGTLRTHGCIRLFNKDVAELFELVKVGTPVYIGDNEYLKTLNIEQHQGEVAYSK